MSAELACIAGTVKRVTARAILLESEGTEGWIPLSLIEDCPNEFEEGDEIEVTIPEWKAEEYWG